MKCYDVSRLPSMITLGYDGENNWRPNAFDCSSLLKNHPDGIISLWLLPSGETQAFPVALERDGSTVVWTPLSEEMTAAAGAFQLVCADGTDVGKSAVVMFRVDESILPGAEHPAAVPSWATQVMEQMQSAVEHYPTIIDGTWHVWDVDNETWEDTGVSAQGVDGADGHSPYIALNGHWMVYSDSTSEWIDTGVAARGADGVSPTVTITEITRGHRVKITDAEHPNGQSFDVTNGFNGLNGTNGADGHSPYADATTGTWWVYDDATGLWVDSHVTAAGTNGKSPYINSSGYWVFWNDSTGAWVVTNYKAAGVDGEDGHSPYIGANGHWFAWDANLAAYDDTGVEAQGPQGDDYVLNNQDKADIAAMALPSDTASGAIASFPDGAEDAAVKSLVAQIAPVQSGSGDPSPTNIRPISGWTSATVTRTGADNQSDTYTIAFPSEAGMVYGGTLDVTNGVLTVDSAIVDMGTLNWMYYSNQQRMVAQVNSAKPAEANVGLDGACSVYKVVNTAYRLAPDKSILIGNNFISNNYAAMVVRDSDYTDAATFKTAVSGQTLVFPIKNPITYQLTPTEVTTLLGVNNIWADTGDVAVDYRADTGLYIQKLTGSSKTPRIAMTASDTTPTLDPNKLYVFPEMATLTPTLATPTDNTIVNEYHFVFDSGSTATVLTLPATVIQPDGFTVEANMHYEISILEGAMTAQGWAVTNA